MIRISKQTLKYSIIACFSALVINGCAKSDDSINQSDTQTTDPQNTDPKNEHPTACLYEDPTPPELSFSSYELFDILFPIRPNGAIRTAPKRTIL